MEANINRPRKRKIALKEKNEKLDRLKQEMELAQNPFEFLIKKLLGTTADTESKGFRIMLDENEEVIDL